MGGSCCQSCDVGKGCDSSSELANLAPLFLSPLDAEESFLVGGVAFSLFPGAPQKVAWRLAILRGTENASEAYELGECDAVRLSIVALDFTGTAAASIAVEGSLDKANWETIRTLSVASLGYLSLNVTGVDFRWVRLRYTGLNVFAFTSCILAATLVGFRL